MTRASEKRSRISYFGLLAFSGLILAGCSDNDSNDRTASPMATVDVTVTNLTANQPLSPMAVMLHRSNWQAFETGTAASEAVEQLAEGGDNSALLTTANATDAVLVTRGGSGALAPGASETLSLQVPVSALGNLSLSMLSMLVNTNDAFAAINAISIPDLALQEPLELDALSYDSGTEANSETADTIPGPAGAGGLQEGFNVNRDDVRDAVYIHAGVVTQATGLASSALDESHRWDHAVAKVRIERTQ